MSLRRLKAIVLSGMNLDGTGGKTCDEVCHKRHSRKPSVLVLAAQVTQSAAGAVRWACLPTLLDAKKPSWQEHRLLEL